MLSAAAEAQERPLVLVTGAAGKIGRHVTAALRKQGFAVRGLTTKPVSADKGPDGIEWRSADFMTSLDMSPHVAGCEAVVHLAAEIVDRTRMQRVNVEATDALAKAAAGAKVGVFVHVSSASVYGSGRSRLVSESSPTVTCTDEVKGEHWAPPAVRHYARSKLSGEHRVIESRGDMRIVIVRPTVVVDVDDVAKVVARKRMRQLMIGRRHAHHVHVADVAEAIVWLLQGARAQPPRGDAVSIYNIAEDGVACRTYGDLTRRLASATGGRPPGIAMPATFDALIELLRFGALPWRYSLGQMMFSNERLMETGFTFSHGVERLYRQVEIGARSPAPEPDPQLRCDPRSG